MTTSDKFSNININVNVNVSCFVTEKMRIGKLAQRAGVTPRTIRYYENLGLLQPSDREGTGFRYYTEAELTRLQKIDCLKSLGLSLEEIASVIDLYFENANELQAKQKVLEILQTHLQETDEKIQALVQFRRDLEANITQLQDCICGMDRQ